MRSITDSAGDFPNCHLCSGFAEARYVALVLGEPVGDFEAEGDGFGVNSVCAANLGCVSIAVRMQIEYFAKENEATLDDVRSITNLKCLRGIDDIVGRQAVVQPTRGSGIADGFTHSHGER